MWCGENERSNILVRRRNIFITFLFAFGSLDEGSITEHGAVKSDQALAWEKESKVRSSMASDARCGARAVPCVMAGGNQEVEW